MTPRKRPDIRLNPTQWRLVHSLVVDRLMYEVTQPLRDFSTEEQLKALETEIVGRAR